MSIELEFEIIDFNPAVKFRPRYCLQVSGANIYSNLYSNFWTDARKWLEETAGTVDTDWVALKPNYRIYFKDKNMAALFKLTFGGFDNQENRAILNTKRKRK